MTRRRFLKSATLLVAAVKLTTLAAAQGPEVQVFKSPYCGCCGAWLDHM